MCKYVFRLCVNEVSQPKRHHPLTPPSASCSCISCFPIVCRLQAATVHRRASGPSSRPGNIQLLLFDDRFGSRPSLPTLPRSGPKASTIGHPFKVEKIDERKCCHKYGDRCSCFRITPIMKTQSFSCIVQFCIDSRVSGAQKHIRYSSYSSRMRGIDKRKIMQ